MRILALLIILSFASATFAETSKDLKIAKNQSIANANFPNPFRPIIDIFKKILGIKPRIIACPVANVENLILSETEISINKTQSIQVHTIAKDPENDVLVYSYVVSGGKIVTIDGTDTNKISVRTENNITFYTARNYEDGAKVIWDLSGVKPGTYTITAAVDDGCGFCGKTMTKTVIVKE